jgi:hypothetical protein
MATKKGSLPVRMVTPEGRVAFPHVFKTRQARDGKEGKFELTLLFPKEIDGKKNPMRGDTLRDKDGNSEPITLARLLKNAKINEWGEDESKWPKNLQTPVQDGDDEDFADKEGFKGHWAMKATAHADSRPSVVGKDGKAITVSGDFYPGCYARAAVYARIWKHETGGVGVRLVLDHVQKTKDGKTFGGKRPVEQVFDPINDGGDDAEEDNDEAFA